MELRSALPMDAPRKSLKQQVLKKLQRRIFTKITNSNAESVAMSITTMVSTSTLGLFKKAGLSV